jgi:uncharacterized phosphatase
MRAIKLKKLYFVRHGQSEFNVSELYAGSSNPPLTTEGRRQAKAAGQEIKKLTIDVIIASPSSRALDTAKIIAKEIGYPLDKIQTNSLLVERDFGKFEGTPWSPDNNLDGVADVESEDSVVHRCRLLLNLLESQPHQQVLLVSHGYTGRALRSLIKADFPMSHPHRMENATLYELL